ncbi:hypothetical protein FEP07_04424 [Burkholderia multivorans]|uniref:hypothetical protein n=7 Tax=Burkholderia multivorans TaxID=87883 RepID=UPI00018E3ADB|nr:hypothetical protein [Burkholderia multivorans]EEE01437.1 conserved hypothetical protein [Burkholderia multivorans CGD1]MBU9651672.1 hypothetical protein [Burkholderia multivorans]MBU9663500.1 hypothetical protein [Burkholderia multivorans]MCA8336095.1 hypothetical protein [Burkholderia multivorans]MDN7953930.1 hypothetical protein [Burkholderia multivorans]
MTARTPTPADPSDPANQTPPPQTDEVSTDREGNVHQKGHGSMDETMIPQKPEPDKGPYEPPPGHLDNPKDVEPPSGGDLSA